VLVDGPVLSARNTVGSVLSASASLRGLEQHAEWWADDAAATVDVRLDEPVSPENNLAAILDRGMEVTWGYRFEELMRACAALMEHADERLTGTATERRTAVVALVTRKTAIQRARVEAIIDSLILGLCDPYDPLTKEHKAWSTNRDRSYLRRPLVQLADRRLAWSAGHMLSSARYLMTLIATGRLRARGELRHAVRTYSMALDRAFEAQLCDACSGLGWDRKLRVKRLGGRKLISVSGNDIGDIDVFAFDQRSGQVWLLDAKRISPALVPNDMRREARALGRAVGKHLTRLEWVSSHRPDLEREIGRPAARGEWTIHAALVSDHPLAGAYLASLELPVWSIDELAEGLKPSG
jgi:hypothetical protein